MGQQFKGGLPPTRSLSVLLFQFQKICFFIQPTAVADQSSVGPDNPVAGDDYRNGIFVVGHAHRTGGFFVACNLRDLTVAPGLAVRDVLQGLPYPQLKSGTAGRKGQIEELALPGKILTQLNSRFLQQRCFPEIALMRAGSTGKIKLRNCRAVLCN